MMRIGPAHMLALGLAIACAETTPGTATSDAAQWELDTLFSIGAPGDSIELQRVRSVLWGKGGRVFVADVSARRVRQFDSTGHYRGDVGRDGAGPGEYRSPNSLAQFGDTLAVLDLGNARIGLFTPAGEWAGSLMAPRISGPEIRLFRVPPSAVYAFGIGPPVGGRGQLAYVRHDASGPRDTVARDTTPGPPFSGVQCSGSDQGLRFFSTPWTVRRLDHPGPANTLLTADNDVHAIIQRNRSGDTVAVFRGPSGAIAITDAEWDAAGSELREYLAADAGAKCNKRDLDRPESKPAIRAFFWSAEGELWVERFAADGFAFDVFDASGRRIATLAAPPRVAEVEPHIAGDRVLLVGETDEGSHVVRAYRIRRR
jgi:hypothetical protein